jgi:outer membrane protein OmpA-like peptidoglycan-associated protein
MQRLSIIFLMSAALVATSACATKKFVRNTVTASSDALSARIDTTEGEIKETRDTLDKKVTTVDGRVTALDTKTTEGLNSVNGAVQKVSTDVQGVNTRTTQAQSTADRAVSNTTALDQKFQVRNAYDVSGEKTVQFKFDSATLDKQYTSILDEVAASVTQNPNAIIVLEGRTDSVGDKNYNVRLGERRIETVRRYLAVDKGVPVYKIHEISLGSEKPVAENKTKDGREKNRAVTMTIMVPKADANVASRNE